MFPARKLLSVGLKREARRPADTACGVPVAVALQAGSVRYSAIYSEGEMCWRDGVWAPGVPKPAPAPLFALCQIPAL